MNLVDKYLEGNGCGIFKKCYIRMIMLKTWSFSQDSNHVYAELRLATATCSFADVYRTNTGATCNADVLYLATQSLHLSHNSVVKVNTTANGFNIYANAIQISIVTSL